MNFNTDYVAPRLELLRKANLFEEQLLTDFEAFLNTPDERELFRNSPLRYAEKYKIPVTQAIDLFLNATHVNLLDFKWGLLCPSCGAFLSTQPGLKWISESQDCSLCLIPDIQPSIDDNIEVAFTVNRSAREIRFHDLENLNFEKDGLHVLFSSSIALYPEVHELIHGAIFDSHRVECEDTVEINMTFEQNHYFVMIPATHCVVHIEVRSGATLKDVEIEILQDGYMLPEYSIVAPHQGKLTIHNRSKNTVVLGLLKNPHIKPTPYAERPNPIPPLFTTKPYLTAKQLVNNQTFRNLFRAESIPIASGMEFKAITMLFTDIKGSTALYDQIGDINAYSIVRDHFSLLSGVIAANGGAIIKTMGDAIMASFAEPIDALCSAQTIHHQIKRKFKNENLAIKIGIHTGACIAVEQNNQLDYFGQTINIASRVQALADANEIIISDAVYNVEGVKEFIVRHKFEQHEESILLKGVTEVTQIYRLKV